MGNRVITIGRESGSGGKEIGRKLAQLLGCPCYDKELIELASKESGIDKSVLEKYDEKTANRFLYSIPEGIGDVSAFGGYGLPINDTLFLAQSQVILKLADKEPCVIVGRSADYVLRDNPDCVSVFLFAPLEYRVRRTMELYQMNEKDAEDYAKAVDKRRKSYYNFYTEKKWGDRQSYHILMDTSLFGAEKTAEALARLLGK